MFKDEAIYYNLFHSDKDYAKQAKQLRKRFPTAVTVLEIGSGTGLMTRELQKQGFIVTALEPSAQMREMAKCNQGNFTLPIRIQDIKSRPRYDLVLALYDVLNYVPSTDIVAVLKRLSKLGHHVVIEMWQPQYVKPFTIKKVEGCTRVRLGFKWKQTAHLWYIYWGEGFLVEHHKLYLHK
jgi:2-polyprenyl-3-methyl-5-hydroxy-6-metoxy-1,4-benzoquinol methylase